MTMPPNLEPHGTGQQCLAHSGFSRQIENLEKWQVELRQTLQTISDRLGVFLTHDQFAESREMRDKELAEERARRDQEHASVLARLDRQDKQMEQVMKAQFDATTAMNKRFDEHEHQHQLSEVGLRAQDKRQIAALQFIGPVLLLVIGAVLKWVGYGG